MVHFFWGGEESMCVASREAIFGCLGVVCKSRRRDLMVRVPGKSQSAKAAEGAVAELVEGAGVPEEGDHLSDAVVRVSRIDEAVCLADLLAEP